MAGIGADKTGSVKGEGDALATAILSALPPVTLPPLFAPSAGAFAAATVMGLGLANQMAGAWLGLMKGAFEQSRVMAEALGAPEREEAGAATPAETAKILPLSRKPAPVAAEPTPVSARPAPKARKPAAKAKAVSAKRTEATPSQAALTDLKQIPGIGPKLEAMLKARGVASLADIAALDSDAVARLDAEIGLDGRILRDNWVGQAQTRLGGGA
nr:helix-hairpin-helix domain-containing protein [uncultured Gellertiella sp.]